MSRTLTNSMSVEIGSTELQPVFLYEGEFVGGTLRLWTGVGTLVHSGENWTGAGQLLGISPIAETIETRAVGLILTLTGMPTSLISTVLGNARYGKPGRLYFACLTASNTVIGDPYLTFSGKLDRPEISDSGMTCSISVRYENALIDLERIRINRYTVEDQAVLYPSDKGFEFVPGLIDKQILWGKTVIPMQGRFGSPHGEENTFGDGGGGNSD